MQIMWFYPVMKLVIGHWVAAQNGFSVKVGMWEEVSGPPAHTSLHSASIPTGQHRAGTGTSPQSGVFFKKQNKRTIFKIFASFQFW